jgi:hypothetical protein
MDSHIPDRPSPTDARDTGVAPDVGAPLSLDECFAGLSAPGTLWIDIQDFRSRDGSITVRRARQPSSAIGMTVPYRYIRFGMVRGSAAVCVTQAADLSYVHAHHNWAEQLDARTPATVYRLKETFDPGRTSTWSFTLTLFNRGTLVPDEGPITLIKAGCRALPATATRDACMY